jgi:hypothetical protein
MVEDAAHRVTTFLRDRVGDGLRTVVIVEEDTYDIAYLDPELEAQYTPDTFGQVVDSFRLENPLFSPGIKNQPVGERRAIVHYHENVFVLQFPYSDTESILISVYPDIGRDLLGFIDECRKQVHAA